jgi:hypothetical protein
MIRHLPVGRSLRTVLFLLLTLAAGQAARASDPVIGADIAAGRLHSWECASGERLGEAVMPGPLTAGPVVDPAAGRVYGAAGVALQSYSLPDLALAAQRRLEAPATHLALGRGAGGVLLVAGRVDVATGSPAQRPTLTAHRPDDLAPAHAWNLSTAGEVTALLAVQDRRRFVLGFARHDEMWEIAWDPDAPPVLRGLVHDYRNSEAVPLPGRFTERAFKVPRATRALVAGGMPYEVLQVDREGAGGIVNLDIRRRTEPVAVQGVRFITAWRGPQGRGWLVFHEDGRITRVSSPDARQQAWGRLMAAPIDVVALPDGSGALVLEGTREGGHLQGGRLRHLGALADTLTEGPAVAGAHRLSLSSAATCVAVVDVQGRWLSSQTVGTAR